MNTYCGVLSKWECFIKMRAAFLAPILPWVMKEGESKKAALILIGHYGIASLIRHAVILCVKMGGRGKDVGSLFQHHDCGGVWQLYDSWIIGTSIGRHGYINSQNSRLLNWSHEQNSSNRWPFWKTMVSISPKYFWTEDYLTSLWA